MSRSDWLGIGVSAILTALGFLAGGPAWGFSILFIGVVCIVRAALSGSEETDTLDLNIGDIAKSGISESSGSPLPELVFTNFSGDLIPQLNKSVFLLHVRNDATSPLATAKNALAHIGYRGREGQGIQVDYGAWMENAVVINIARGQTKRLIVALNDQGKNMAVNFTGPRTDFKAAELIPVGDLTPGQWMMAVKINAENYEKTGYFILTVESNGATKCDSIKQMLW